MTEITPTHTQELALTKGDALAIEREAKRHLDGFTSNGFALAVDLRRLQDGGAHVLRGYPTFGEYIEAQFAGQISASNGKTLSVVGRVLMTLIEAKRIKLATAKGILGTTGARALAAVQGRQGDERMLAVFDEAASIAKDRKGVITDEIVAAILTPQLPPQPEPVLDPVLPDPEPWAEEPHDDVQLTEDDSAALDLVDRLDESGLKLADLIHQGQASSGLAIEYARAMADDVQQLVDLIVPTKRVVGKTRR